MIFAFFCFILMKNEDPVTPSESTQEYRTSGMNKMTVVGKQSCASRALRFTWAAATELWQTQAKIICCFPKWNQSRALWFRTLLARIWE